MMNFVVRGAAMMALAVACGYLPAQESAAPASTGSAADGAGAAAVRAAMQERLGPKANVAAVRRTPAGLWEVQVGKDVVYTDDKVTYLFVGKLIDMRSREDLTQARVDELNRIDFKTLPLELAMKTVRGKGERVVAIFADPNCGFCKRFENAIATMDNVTIYTFLYPILSDDSVVKSRQIWCSADRQKVWDAWMRVGAAPTGKGDCATPLDKVAELGHRLDVTATPTLFFADGHRVAGALPLDQFENQLKVVSATN